jgi:hypothetical protein
MDRLGDRQSEYRNDRWIGHLAEELCPEESQYVCEGFAIVRHGQVSGYLHSRSARADARN